MDLSTVLDATEPVSCEFLGKEIVAHVYTAGVNRLRKEDRDKWEALTSPPVDFVPVNDSNGDPIAFQPDSILLFRAMLPEMISGWDFDGSPMERDGKPYPPTPENVAACPDILLLAVGNAVLDKWNEANPTIGTLPETGSSVVEMPEPSLAESSVS